MLAFLKRYWPALFIVVNILAVCVVVVLDPELLHIDQLIRSCNPRWMLLAVGFTIIFACFDGLAQHRMIQHLAGPQKLMNWLKLSLLGKYYNAITPFSSGGQPLLIMHMNRYGIPMGQCSFLIFYRYLTYQLALGVVAVFALFFQGAVMFRQNKVMFIALVIGCIVNFGLPFLVIITVRSKKAIPTAVDWIFDRLEHMRWMRNRQKWEQRKNDYLDDFRNALAFGGRNRSDAFALFICGLIEVIATICVPFCVYRALGLSGASFISITAMTLLLMVAVSYAPTPGASGASEGGFFLLFQMYFPRSHITAGLLLWRLFSYYTVLLLGAGVLLAETASGRWRSRSMTVAPIAETHIDEKPS